ncbi:MAG: ATP-binding cassette domain-containing protein [Gammaproteobacteria bacterium]|nr:ATP-binding cassette domain-containing protein [Gammaproteobacteria bacterium]
MPAIEIEGLCTVLGTTLIHRNVNLQVRSGEVLAIIGASGSGKTTLLREMLGLLAPSRGEVRVLGANIRSLTRRERQLLPTRCGVVFQNGALFSALSSFDNVALPVRENRWWPDDLLADLVLATLQATGMTVAQASKLPAELSGGMVKRVALARALILEPELLFMDEPTSGLAPDQRHAVIGLLARLKREFELTVVVVTHDVDVVVGLADRVAVLADQHILTVAPLSEIADVPHPFVQSFFFGQRDRCGPGRIAAFRSHLQNTAATETTE